MKEQWEKYKKLFSLMFDDLKTKGRRHRQIPNILTMLRLVAPVIVIPAFATGNLPFAFWSIATFAATDAVDGFIARTFKLTSDLGRDLDAIADKTFAATLLISLSTVNPIYLISLVLEGLIGSICAYKKVQNIDIRTCKVGKLKTILLDLSVVMGIGSLLIDLSPILLNIMCITTGVLQVITAKEYVKVNKSVEQLIEVENKEDKQSIFNEDEKEEVQYQKTLSYPKGKPYGNRNEKKLVKTIRRN